MSAFDPFLPLAECLLPTHRYERPSTDSSSLCNNAGFWHDLA